MSIYDISYKKIIDIFKYIALVIMFLVLHIAILIVGNNLLNLFMNPRENINIYSSLNAVFTIIIILIIMKTMGFKKEDIIRKENFKIDVLDLIIIIVIYLIFVAILELIKFNIETNFFKEFHMEHFNNHIKNFTKPQFDTWLKSNIILVIISSMLLPIMEELYFRVFIHKTLIKYNYSTISIIFISAMTFGFRHWFFSPFGVLVTVLAGAFFSVIMIATKNILYPIFLHGVVRLVMILYLAITEADYTNISRTRINISYIITLFLVFIVFCIISYIKRKSIFSDDIIKNFKYEFK